MNLNEIVKELELIPLTSNKDSSEILVTTAYQSDLLSCVMSGGGEKSIWVTLINNITDAPTIMIITCMASV